MYTNARVVADIVPKYEVKLKEKKFLCFNKLERQHRVDLLERMLKFNLVDKGFYSFQGEGDWIANMKNLAKRYPIIHANRHRFPMVLNITPDRSNPVDIRTSDFIYHQESYFSIVTETMFYDVNDPKHNVHKPPVLNSIFFTEKTYRCFLLRHPFVLFGRAGSLKMLKKEGYKTFSPFINESYDNIENDYDRFDAIFAEIQRLVMYSDAEWIEFQESLKDNIEHNYNVVIDKDKVFYVKPFNF